MWPAIIAGGAALLGGVLQNRTNAQIAGDTSAFNAEQAALNRTFQAEQAEQQMDFQKHMSNTAHTREVRDLRRAGLNPILSGTGGMGAASAAGAAAHGSQASGVSYEAGDVLGKASSSAQAAHRLQADVDLTRNLANTAHYDALKREEETSLKRNEEPALLRAQTKEVEARTRREEQQTETERAMTRLRGHEASILQSSAVAAKLEEEMDSGWYGGVLRYINRMSKSIQGRGHTIRDLR